MPVPLIVQYQEPVEFFAGDTLYFQKNLPDFLATDGWSLLYEIRGGIEGGVAVSFTSTPVPPGNTMHQVEVDPATTQGWLAGSFVLVGFAVNPGPPDERHQIYYAALEVKPNLGNNADDVPVTTHAQRMIPLLEAQLETLAVHGIQDSTVEQTEIRRVRRRDLEDQLARNKEIRRNEIANENVRNGRPSGNKIVGLTAIVPCGPLIGSGASWPVAP